MITHEELVRLLVRTEVIKAADAGTAKPKPAQPEPRMVKVGGRMVPSHLAAMVRAEMKKQDQAAAQ